MTTEIPEHLQARIDAAAVREGPKLGLATNEEMLRELICRFKMVTYMPGSTETHQASVERALVLAEMLGGMGAPEREYRTVGH